MRKGVLIGVVMLMAVIPAICAAGPLVATTLPANATMEARLAESMRECNLNKSTYGDVIDFVRDVTGLSLIVDKGAMREAGISDKDPMTLRLPKVKRRQCLDTIAKSISKPGHPIVVGVVGNIVVITSPARLEKSIKQQQADAAKVEKNDVAHLNRNLPEMNFNKTQLGDVIDFLTDVTGAEIKVNWNDLKAAGVARDVPIDLRLREVPYREILRAVLDQAVESAQDKGDLDFTVGADGLIKIMFVPHAT